MTLPGAPIEEDPEAHVERLVAKARRTAASAQRAPPLAREAFEKTAQALVGLNAGPDQVSEVFVRSFGGTTFDVDAFDRAGYHVLNARLQVHAPQMLHVDLLKASHGRNVDDNALWTGAGKVPGRGNARVISEALHGMVELAVEHGFTTLGCTPASNEVAKLYAKMGFTTADGEPRARVSMQLDLTNPAALRQALVVFAASRANITDVPKDVADRIAQAREHQSPPSRAQFGAFIHNLDNVTRFGLDATP
jgi:hypothetical protein